MFKWFKQLFCKHNNERTAVKDVCKHNKEMVCMATGIDRVTGAEVGIYFPMCKKCGKYWVTEEDMQMLPLTRWGQESAAPAEGLEEGPQPRKPKPSEFN
jgi:hypothetical protein